VMSIRSLSSLLLYLKNMLKEHEEPLGRPPAIVLFVFFVRLYALHSLGSLGLLCVVDEFALTAASPRLQLVGPF